MIKRILCGAAAVVAMAALPHLSGASTITDGGLEAGFGCTNGFQCGNGSETFVYDSPTPFASATGTVDMNVGSLTLDLDWTV